MSTNYDTNIDFKSCLLEGVPQSSGLHRGIADGGIVNAGYILGAGVKKEKPRLRYMRGQWMQITDRREQYYAKLKALEESVDLMFIDTKLQNNAGEFYGMSLQQVGNYLKGGIK